MIYKEEQIGDIIKKERKAAGLTQAELGDKIGVVGKQVSKYESGNPIPPLDTLLKLCEVFKCELGYLLGEPQYANKDFIRTRISFVTGLSDKAMDSILSITDSCQSSLRNGDNAGTRRIVLDKLLSSNKFPHFIEALSNLEESIRNKNRVWEDIILHYGEERYLKAFDLYNSNTDYLTYKEQYQLDPIMYEILDEIESAIIKSHDLSYPVKVHRYELFEAFEKLIDDVFPQDDKNYKKKNR